MTYTETPCGVIQPPDVVRVALDRQEEIDLGMEALSLKVTEALDCINKQRDCLLDAMLMLERAKYTTRKP